MFPPRLLAMILVAAQVQLVCLSWQDACSAGPVQDEVAIESWVKQLSSERFAVRENATRQLIAAGPSVIDYVLEEIRSGGLEASTRGLTVLRELALRDDLSAAKAEDVIKELTKDHASSVARRASSVLNSIEEIRTDRGIKMLSRLGATFSKSPVPYEVFVAADIYVTIGKKWTGTLEDLDYIGWLTEFDRLHFTLRGECVTDQWLARICSYPQIVGLQVNRASVTDAGMASLKGLAKLELLSLRYDGLTAASLEFLKSVASNAPLRVLEVFGTQIPGDSLNQLDAENETLIIRYRRGGFLGVSGKALTARRNGEEVPVGCYISSVQPNEAAARAGLRRGDVVIRYKGQPVTEFSRQLPTSESGLSPTLAELIALDAAGESVEVTILRGGKEITKQIVLGEWP